MALGQVSSNSAVANRRAAVAMKLLSSGHKSMLDFFIPPYDNKDSESDSQEEKLSDLDVTAEKGTPKEQSPQSNDLVSAI